MTRRTFLEFSAGALGASAFGAHATAQNMELAKIYTVLFDVAPSRDDTSLEPLANDEIIRRLQTACGGVEFTVRDLTRGARLPSVLNEMKDLRRSGYDGVIVYGWPRDYDLLRTGLPTINVMVVNDFENVPHPLFKQHRVIGAALDPWRFSEDRLRVLTSSG
jgi:predicted acylesterase/phospholipase RssA